MPTSAAFAQQLDWAKLDVVTFSWQKALGGEGGHGVLILSPRAVERLESYSPAWPMPKIFRMTKGGKLIEGIFEGETINTPSMLCVEDYIDALNWAKSVGGLDGMIARADANTKVLADWVGERGWAAFLAKDEAIRSNTSVCLKVVDPADHLPPAGRAGGLREETRLVAGEGKGGLRHRRLSRRPSRPARLVRRDRRDGGCRPAHAMARLGLCDRQGRTRGHQEALRPPMTCQPPLWITPGAGLFAYPFRY